jgi:hypothetical protein
MSAPVTNYIDNIGNQQTPNGLTLPQDLNKIFISHSGSYNFTNTTSGLTNATGFNYYNGSNYVDISNIFDISTNPASYRAAEFLVGFKIPYNGVQTDLGKIFGLIKPIPLPSWSGFYRSTSSYPSGSTFQYNSIAMSSSGQYLTAVTNDGYVWTSNTYGYDPSGSWTKGPHLVTNPDITKFVIWSGCAMSLSGMYQAAFFSIYPNPSTYDTYSSNYGQSTIFYSTNYGSDWFALYAASVGSVSNSTQFGNGSSSNYSRGCAFFNMVLSNDGDTLSICSNVTATNSNPQDNPFSVTYTYTKLTTGNNNYRFNKNILNQTAPTGSAPITNGVPLYGCGLTTGGMQYSLAMNASGSRIFGLLPSGAYRTNYLNFYTDYAITDSCGNTIFNTPIQGLPNSDTLPDNKGPLYIVATRNPNQSDVNNNGTQLIIGYTYDVGLYYTEMKIDNSNYPTPNSQPTIRFVNSGSLFTNKVNSSAMTVNFDKNTNTGYIFSVKTQSTDMYRYTVNGGSTVLIGSSSFSYNFCANLVRIGEYGNRCPNNAVCCSEDGTYVAAITTGGIYVCSTGKTTT